MSTGAFAQPTLLQKAKDAYLGAQHLEASFRELSPEKQTRAEFLKLINAYQRVYLTTPKTSYADNALMAVARLYGEIKETRSAVRTLDFLLREYPGSPLRSAAEKDLQRLTLPQSADSAVPLMPKPPPANAPPVPAPAAPGLQPTAASPVAISIENVRYWEASKSVRVVVDLSAEAVFRQGEARSPDRVFIDIQSARLSPAIAAKQWPVKLGLLEQVRVGQFDGSTVRVVLDVVRLGRVTAFTLKDPHRLIIDVLGEGPATTTASAAETSAGTSTSTKPAPSVPGAAAVESAGTPVPAVPNREERAAASTPTVEAATVPDVTVPKPSATKPDAADPVVVAAKPTAAGNRSLIRSLGLKISRVIIDPGHGGHDTGSIGPSGFTEKDLVLDVSLRLKELIETQLGAEVVMTRSDDTFVPLEARTALANQSEADLFISVHANSSRTRTVRGVETFFLNFTTSREALETASRENATSERSVHELQDIVKKIMLQDKVEESREFATHVQRALASRRGAGVNRGVKKAPFVVLIGANMPSILAEVAFISHPQEEKNVRSQKVRQEIALALFSGVRSYAETLSGVKTARTQDKTDKNQQ